MKTLPKYWLLVAFLIHLLAAWFSVGHYHDDEYYQILDLAAFKLGFEMQNEVMWEYDEMVRSGLQPFIAFAVTKVFMFFGITSPFFCAFILRIISSVISLFAIVVFINAIQTQIRSKTVLRWTSFFLLFSWLLVFMNVRFSSEGWAMSCFILGYGIYLDPRFSDYKKYFLTGLLFGICFLARFQSGFLLLGLGCWMLFQQRESVRNFSTIIVGGIAALLIGVFIDYWLYGALTSSAWNIFEWHMLKGSLDNIVHEPWWFYIYYSSVQLLPPITLLTPAVVILFWFLFPRHSITWLTIPFILFHHYFGHKEMRYLFPILPFAPIMFAMLFEKLKDYFDFFNTKTFTWLVKITLGLSVIINMTLVLLVISLPASKEVAIWQNCLAKYIPIENAALLVYDPDGSGSAPGELELDFYNEKNIPIIPVRDEEDIYTLLIKSPDKNYFYAARKKSREDQLNKAAISHQLICRALPDWLLKININNWTSRTSMWRVWEISHDKPK